MTAIGTFWDWRKPGPGQYLGDGKVIGSVKLPNDVEIGVVPAAVEGEIADGDHVEVIVRRVEGSGS